MRNPLVIMSVLMLSPVLLAATEQQQDEVCRLVPIHKPAADVAYQPGVDVDGNAVAPADLPSSGGIILPAEIGINLRVPLADVLGAATPRFLGDAGVDVGQVTVNRQTGALFYNGQRLDAPYAVLCEPKED